MTRLQAIRGDDRAVSATVTHVLALGITALLISGLLLSAGTVLESQRENSAREQLRTVGNRISAELSRAAVLAQDGGNVSIQTNHPNRIAGQSYDVDLLTGAACDTNTFDSEACLRLAIQGDGTSVMVPVRNETGVTMRATGAGSFSIVSVANESASGPSTAAVDQDLRVGVGEDIGEFGGGSIVNLTNRDPISGFVFSPGQPTVDSSIHFRNDTEDLDGAIASYEWDMGDGNTRTGHEFNYSYASPGKYTVTLTVTDDDGETDNVSKVVSVGGLVFDYATGTSAGSPGDMSFAVINKHSADAVIRQVLVDPNNDSIDEMDDFGGNVIHIYGDVQQGGYDDDADIHDDGRIFDLSTGSPGGTGYPILSAGDNPAVDLSGFQNDSNLADMAGEEVLVAMRYEVNGQFYATKFTLNGPPPSNLPPTPAFDVDCDDDTKECEFDPAGSSDDDGISTFEWEFGDGNTTSETNDVEVDNTYPTNGSYDVSLTVTDGDGVSSTLTKSVTIGGEAPVVVWAVNSGGDTYTADGITYERDIDWDPHEYGSGDENYADTGDLIANTSDDTLYESERYGNFEYEVPVPNGEYHVTFLLAETYWTNDNDRIFDVSLEGTEVISDLDIHADVGHDYATTRAATTTVSDGTLDIEFDTDVDNAKSAAIVVTRLDALAYLEKNNVSNRVVMEAENYMRSVPGSDDNAVGDDMSGDSWVEATGGDASDNTLLQGQPDNNDNAGDTENGPRLDYYVNFTNTGTYEVWVRMECPGWDSDSVHVGLNGTPQSYGDVGLTESDTQGCGGVSGWMWATHADGSQVTVEVDSAGVHTFNLWMREDGTKIDKIVLRKSGAGSEPSGDGPSESPIG